MEDMNNIPQQQGNGQNDKKGLAIASMVLGIISLVLFCLWYVSIPCAVLAIIFGALSTKSSGRGMAIAGLVMAIVAIAVVIIVAIAAASFINNLLPFMDNYGY